MKRPPWNQTITGRFSEAEAAPVQTFRDRQSSLNLHSGLGTTCRGSVCGQKLPKVSALRTPCHGTGGCGARQRRSPTGGAA